MLSTTGRRFVPVTVLAVTALVLSLLATSCTADSQEAAGPRDPLAEKSSAGAADDGNGPDRGSAPTGTGGAALAWTGCDEDILSDLECAVLEVPLDPDEAAGPSIELALARRAATRQDGRIGSVLVNPGGPGASGVELVPQLASVVDDSVLERFDLVGFDPRGVGRSTAVHCIDDQAALNALDADPDTPAEIDAAVAVQAETVATCTQRHPELLPHLSTADAAHDLDQIRRAVGDDKLTYLGFSYGTELGATYATLFPDRIRALVLDGAVGPDLSDEELSKTQAEGFERAFANFAEGCRTDARCAAKPDARALYDKVHAAVEQAPIPVSTAGETRDLAVGDFQIGVISALYDQALWAYLARGLLEAANRDGATLLALADLYHQRKPDGSYPNSADAYLAISCADSTERATVEQAEQAAARYRAAAPLFGAQLGWSAMACNGWPQAAEPDPPVATTTDAPILVVGTINDPATPYVWAEQLTEALAPTSRLLTWEGEGHTAYLKSQCVTEAVDRFLVDLTLPADDTRCQSDADRRDSAFAGIAPDLRDAFMENSGLSEALATCIADEVAELITATELVAIYSGAVSDSLQKTINDAATGCARGG